MKKKFPHSFICLLPETLQLSAIFSNSFRSCENCKFTLYFTEISSHPLNWLICIAQLRSAEQFCIWQLHRCDAKI